MSLFTPINQKRLTNVSVLRLKKNGNRYEIACYPNKVKAWRDNFSREKNIDEVLQTHEIFSNVSKGQLATKANIMRDFDTDDADVVLRFILDEGEIQFTGKERKVENQSLFRDVAKLISEKCINPETHRAYSVTMIEKMMRDCHINLQPKKSAKQQALEVIKQLRAVDGFKIAPAMMEVLISLDSKLIDSVSPQILKFVYQIIRQEKNSEGIFELVAIIEPENYHALSKNLEQLAKNRFCIEIMGSARPRDFLTLASSSAYGSASTATSASTTLASKATKKTMAFETSCATSLSDLPEEEFEAPSLPLNPTVPYPTISAEVEEEKVLEDKKDDYSTAVKKVTRQQKNKKRNKKNRLRDDDANEDDE